MGDINLSLDDIIKKRYNKPFGPLQRFNERRNIPPIKRLGDNITKPFFPKKQGIADARLKLLRNKSRRDVGELETPVADARFRLQAMRNRGATVARRGRVAPAVGVLRRTVPAGVAMEVDDYDMPLSNRPLLRTVENDMSRYRRPYDWDRPIEHDDLDYDRIKRANADLAPTGGFNPDDPSWRDIRISVKNTAAAGTVGILKRPENPYMSATRRLSPPRGTPGGSSRTLSERFHHDRNAEAALKVQALKAQLKAAQGEPVMKMEGYRIVVSNLVPSVTPEDVQELFADVGELISSKVVRPGVAEVVYQHYDDAVKAVDVYHNRQLDGQPMKCLLVKNNQAIPKRAKAVELDLATLRNALHKKPTS